MKKKNTKESKQSNYSWETTYKIKKYQNGYNINQRKEYTSVAKVLSAIAAITIILFMLTAIYFFFKDNDLTKAFFEVSNTYIFIGLTTFVIFLVFKTNKKEYNKNKKGAK